MNTSSTGDLFNFGSWISTSDNTSWDNNTLYIRRYEPPSTPPQIIERVVERVIEKQEVKPMRGLYRVYFVHPETEEIKSFLVVAKYADSAKIKAFRILETLHSAGEPRDYDDYDVIVKRLGDVRPKKEVQEVKVVKE